MMKVLILGCGPAGLLACHAARAHPDVQVVILSRKVPSPLHGCQYLHEPIPLGDTSLHSTVVDYQLRGTVEDYARKVYGGDALPVTSPQLYTGQRPAWSLRQAYAWLWEQYQDLIIDAELKPQIMSEVLADFRADLVLGTIPAPALCRQGDVHTFSSVRCWAIGDAPQLGQTVPFTCERSTVVCDGTPEHGYYRISNVFGHTTVEWPGRQKKPPISGVVPFDKPLKTTCDCWPQITRLGRYGTWTKGVLAHHVYAHTHNLFVSRG